jgi:type III secretion protein L
MSSNVIKARAVEPSIRPSVVKRNVQIASQEANQIRAHAEDEAHEILSEALRKAQGIFDAARENGYQSGVAQWYEALGTAWKARDDYLAGNETALLKLAVRIAEKLVGQELHIAPDSIAGIVSEALRSVRRAKSFTVQAHPADIPALQERLSALGIPAGAAREIQIVPNASLSRGDCIIETDIGIIDARLETQLKNMERALILKTAT